MKEKWLEVVGYEGRYAVSNTGRVRNLRSGYVLAGGISSQGYWRVKLSDDDGTEKYKLIHVLQAEAFFGPRPDGARIVHLNGIKEDNRLGNLRYIIEDTAKAQKAYQRHLRALREYRATQSG